ncbi:MAG TPA: hypothetical protein VIL97_09740 [Thermoanaerobaculia bacterium]
MTLVAIAGVTIASGALALGIAYMAMFRMIHVVAVNARRSGRQHSD